MAYDILITVNTETAVSAVVNAYAEGGGGSGVTDHGALTGLSDDDHTQYHNDTRGDARYYTKSQADDLLDGKAEAVHGHDISDVANLQTTLDGKAASVHTHDDRYYTETETDSLLADKADLVGGVIPTNQIPAIAVTDFLGDVASEAAMLALSGQKGDWCNRTDESKSYVITGNDPTQASDWTPLEYPGGGVTSVNGETGTVVITTANISDSTNKRYVTDAEKTKLSNTSGTNTGDQDLSGLAVKTNNLSDLTNAATARTNLGFTNALVKVSPMSILNTRPTDTGVIPFDDTIPQSSEGAEFLTIAYTPISAANRLRVRAFFPSVSASAAGGVILALFKDSETDARAVAWRTISTANHGHHLEIVYEMIAGTTSEITFKSRIGTSAAATTYVNGNSSGRAFGGTLYAFMQVEEYTP